MKLNNDQFGILSFLIFALICLLCFGSEAVASSRSRTTHLPTGPAVHQVKMSPREGEFLIDTNVAHVPAIGNQESPVIASDSNSYFAVWTHNNTESALDIYGTRINRTGNVLDKCGIAISEATGNQNEPALAFDGENYLVVWEDNREGSASIYGARVDGLGNVLDPDGFTISDSGGSPSIVFDGTNFLVVWVEAGIRGRRVDQSGTVLDTNSIKISDIGVSPSLTFDGTNYFAVWSSSRHIFGARVNQSGIVLDTTAIEISIATWYLGQTSIASCGSNYLVVWFTRGFGGPGAICGARVSHSGILLDSTEISIGSGGATSVAFDGSNYLVAWRSGYTGWDTNIRGTRIDTSGAILDSIGFAISTAIADQLSPAVAFSGTNYFVVWEDERVNWDEKDIYGTRVDRYGNVLDPYGIVVSSSAYAQYSPSIAFDSNDFSNYLVVWQDYRNVHNEADIYGTRINQSGVILDPNGIGISTQHTGASRYQKCPSVAFDGANYLVVWENAIPNIYGTRVNRDGVVLDPSGIGIAVHPLYPNYSPSVAFDGSNYLVVFVRRMSPATSLDIYGARVAPSGNVLDPGGIPISSVNLTQDEPYVAFHGNSWLVVWEDNRSGTSTDIYGARVNQWGGIYPGLSAISTATGNQLHPSCAFDGTNSLVVWQDRRNGSDFDIYGARLDQWGTVLDHAGIPICTADDNQRKPRVFFDGTAYAVIWQDYRSDSSWNIRGAKVNTSGVVVDSFVFSQQPGDQTELDVVYGTSGQFLVVYSYHTDSIHNQPANTMRIWGKFHPNVGIEGDTESTTKNPRFNLRVSPNPFRHTTIIRYSILDTRFSMQNHTLRIYDATGSLVKSFDHESCIVDRGSAISWDGTDQAHRQLGNGVYFITLQTGNLAVTEKVLLIR